MRVTKLASFLALATTAGLAIILASIPATASPIGKIDAVKVNKDSRGIKPYLDQNTSMLGALSVLPPAARETDNAEAGKATTLEDGPHIRPDVQNPICRSCPCSETGKLCSYHCCIKNAKAAAARAIRGLSSAVATGKASRSHDATAAEAVEAAALYRQDVKDLHTERASRGLEPTRDEQRTLRAAAPQGYGPICHTCRCYGTNQCSEACCSTAKRAFHDNVHVLYPRSSFSWATEEDAEGRLAIDGAPVRRDSLGEGDGQARAQTHRDLPLLVLDGIGEEH